ncbi:hypothetical protein OE810_10850 [Rhodobacteraceae bacterium XHP0102]|nr:hypothetical protein [Rhodobacteraceae bacterium XHP0102]
MGLDFKKGKQRKPRFGLLLILIALGAVPSQLAVADVANIGPQALSLAQPVAAR